jgi:hypothetical protein
MEGLYRIFILIKMLICCFSHALLAVGYSDHSKAFIVRNSWGESWVRLMQKFDLKYKRKYFRVIVVTVIFLMLI